jgi:hypothetical protein
VPTDRPPAPVRLYVTGRPGELAARTSDGALWWLVSAGTVGQRPFDRDPVELHPADGLAELVVRLVAASGGIMTSAEVSSDLGHTDRSGLSQLRRRYGPDFPRPLRARPLLFLRSEYTRWRASGRRRPGRPRASTRTEGPTR